MPTRTGPRHIIRIKATTSYTPTIEALRREAFGIHRKDPSTSPGYRDEFDDASIHVVATLKGLPVAVGRLTPEPPSLLQKISGGRAPVPTGEGVVDISRFAVAPARSGIGLFRLVMAEALLKAVEMGAEVAVAVIEAGVPHKRVMDRLGFEDMGAPILYRTPPFRDIQGQTQMNRLRETAGRIRSYREEAVAGLNRHGYEVHSEVVKDRSAAPMRRAGPAQSHHGDRDA